MEISFISNPDYSYDIVKLLKYDNLKIKCINIDSEMYGNLDFIDFIPFTGIQFHFNVSDNEHIRQQFIKHPNFDVSLKNPNIPIMIFHQHEILLSEQMDIVTKMIKEELNISRDKIIVMDCCITKRSGMINPPIVNKLKQFFINVYDEESVRNKKFTFLCNKNSIIRFQIFDKLLKLYKNDIKNIREENIISFRNYDDTIFDSSDVINTKVLQHYIDESSHYKFHNNVDFYKNINLPWTFDSFDIRHVHETMFIPQQELYSQSFFSIISETYSFYMKLEYDEIPDEMAFSEKLFVSLSAGSLPFIINFGTFYIELENEGFDFSYLKTIFGINYRENTCRENFDSIDKFIGFLQSKTIDELQEIYQSVQPILNKNIDLIRKIQNKELTPLDIKFINEIKKLK